MAARWYVLQTRPQQERLAELNLEAAGFPVFLPLATRRAYIRNMAVEQSAPLFGPYLFVGFDIEVDRWRPVNSTRGVVRLLPRHLEEPLALVERQKRLIRKAELTQARLLMVINALRRLLADVSATVPERITRVRRSFEPILIT
jgi:transcription antitermination factor NusG